MIIYAIIATNTWPIVQIGYFVTWSTSIYANPSVFSNKYTPTWHKREYVLFRAKD